MPLIFLLLVGATATTTATVAIDADADAAAGGGSFICYTDFFALWDPKHYVNLSEPHT